MASLQVGAKVQGTTNTPPRGGSEKTASSEAAVSRAKVFALGLFVVLVILHSQKGEQ